MHDWADLKRRLDRGDRRCFAFVHPCMPGEPLVLLHTALAQEPARTLEGIISAASASGPAPSLMTMHGHAAGGSVGQEARTAAQHGHDSPPKVRPTAELIVMLTRHAFVASSNAALLYD